MRIEKNIFIFNKKEPISIAYTKSAFKIGDTAITQYNTYKISILMTDGINAMVRNSIIHGKSGNILFFRPDELHFARFPKSGTYAYLDVLIPIMFFDEFVNSASINNFLTDHANDRRNCIHFDSENKNTINKLVSEILDYIKSDDENNIKLFSLILQILILCNDCYCSEKSLPLNCEIPDIVLNTMQYISDNYNQKISLKEVADKSHCSITYLSRIFKQHTGKTIYEYVTTIRILKSQILLREGKSVTEACFASGFNDCSNFINKFKKITNQTPSQFKKM